MRVDYEKKSDGASYERKSAGVRVDHHEKKRAAVRVQEKERWGESSP